MCAKAETEDADHGTDQQLLSDIREVCDDFHRSTDLVAQLKMLHDSPWFDEMLTASRLASKLRAYGIHPRHSTDKTCRGYYRCDFRDAWARYLPENPSKPSHASDVWPDQYVSRDSAGDGTAAPDGKWVSGDTDPSDESPSSETVLDSSDGSDAQTAKGKNPTPRDVADARIAKGKEIFESGKYAPR
jgi:hypothetical protein